EELREHQDEQQPDHDPRWHRHYRSASPPCPPPSRGERRGGGDPAGTRAVGCPESLRWVPCPSLSTSRRSGLVVGAQDSEVPVSVLLGNAHMDPRPRRDNQMVPDDGEASLAPTCVAPRGRS